MQTMEMGVLKMLWSHEGSNLSCQAEVPNNKNFLYIFAYIQSHRNLKSAVFAKPSDVFCLFISY